MIYGVSQYALHYKKSYIEYFIRFLVFTKFHNMHFGVYKTLVMCYTIVILLGKRNEK